MISGPSKFWLVLALGVAAGPLMAGETIDFSTPADAATNQTVFSTDNPQGQTHAGDYNAPRRVSNGYSPDLPLPQPIYFSGQTPAARDALDRRKNWALMTPEQILGIETPESIFGLKNSSREKNLPLEQQYLLRENQKRTDAAATGKFSPEPARTDDNPLDRNYDDENPFSRTAFSAPDEKSQARSSQYLNQFMDPNAGGSYSGNVQKQTAAWTSLFAQPAQIQPTPGQLADMERFRAMMEPASSLEKSPEKVQTVSRLFNPPAPPVDPFLQLQPLFNPSGHSAAVVEDNISRLAGIQPLPGITGPPKITPQVRPAWQAQLPPWLSSGPQAHNSY